VLRDLLNQASIPEEANLFLELFLADSNGDLVDIPVVNRNLRLGDGSTPNKGLEVVDSWVLTRRFFVYDTISGIDKIGGYRDGNVSPEYIRWASDIKLKIEMDMEETEQIYRPYLILDFREKESLVVDASSVSKVVSSVEYFSNFEDKMSDIVTALICMSVFAVVVASIKVYYYTKRNPRAALRGEHVKMYSFKIVFHLLDSWSEYMFWMLFFVSCSIFIPYKLQMNAYLLLPELGKASEANYQLFNTILTMALVSKLVAVIMKIVEQANIDIFIIDFEKPNLDTK